MEICLPSKDLKKTYIQQMKKIKAHLKYFKMFYFFNSVVMSIRPFISKGY